MITDMPNGVAYISDAKALRQLARQMHSAPWIALDTEFMRERTYYPVLCLVQVCDGTHTACIDPLAIDDLSALADLLSNPAIIKVVHAAFQDMEVLLQATGALPQPVFDTQVAAALLGHADQIGYARLVEALLGVHLEKAQTRSDWSRRPLGTGELQYAADDVTYLAQAFPIMQEQLAKRGRLEWVQREFSTWNDPARYRVEPDAAWQKVRGHKRLQPAQQQALKLLAAWRERRAIQADKPRKWILKDDALLDIARKRPRDTSALDKVRGLPAALTSKHGEALVALCNQAREMPASPLAAQPVHTTPSQQALVDLLMATLRAQAARVDISAGLLASRKELERLVAGEQNLPILSGWRHEAAGKYLLEVLHGKKTLRVDAGQLHIRNSD